MSEQLSELMQAQYRGDRARVERLLADTPPRDVFEAAAVGATDRLRELLDADPALAGAWSFDGAQPLHFAAFFGHLEACRLLVERGADIDSRARGFNGVAPINSAAACDGKPNETCTAIVRLLLDAGADPRAAQHGGATALDAARQCGNDELVELLEARL